MFLCLASFSVMFADVVRVVSGYIAIFYFVKWIRKNRSAGIIQTPRVPEGLLAKLSLAATFIALGCALIGANAPVTSWDAGVAHMALPAAYAREGRIGVEPGNNYSAYPHLMHALFTVQDYGAQSPMNNDSFGWRREARPAQIVWSFGILLCAAAYWLAVRVGGRQCGFVAAAIVATAPVFIDQSSIPGIDVPYAATVMGALCALVAWRQDKRIGWLVLAAILAGNGCGIRHTAYLVNAMLAVGVVAIAGESRVRNTGLFLGTAFASALPWLVRTALVSGNPFYPFFSSQSAAMPDVNVAAIGSHSSIQGTGPFQLLAFPWSLTMNPAHYGGWSTSPGALWLVLGVIGVIVGGRSARALGVFSGAGLIVIFFFQRFARYALPFIAPMMVVAALPVEKLPRLRWVMVPAVLLSYALGLGPVLANAAAKVPVVIGVESREDYLTKRVERFPAMAWAARNLPSTATILSLDPRGFYFAHPTYTNFEALKALVPRDLAAQLDWLRAREIEYLFYPAAYVDSSPAFSETGVGAMVDVWRANSEQFILIKQFELPNPRSGRVEHVEIYEFRSE